MDSGYLVVAVYTSVACASKVGQEVHSIAMLQLLQADSLCEQRTVALYFNLTITTTEKGLSTTC